MSRRLKLLLPKRDIWDDVKEEFGTIGGVEVELEHSLYTIAGWEAKWHIPFAKTGGLTQKEFVDYIINFMCQTPDIPSTAWLTLDEKCIKMINDYMEDPHSGTSIKSLEKKRHTGRKEIPSAEILYFYMFQMGIPMECERWHLNRLLMLIDVCAIKSGPQKKMSHKDATTLRQQQNAAMRAKLGSRG